MKLYTIDDLRNGICAVKNDGTLAELNEVLQLAFPNSKLAKGTRLFYNKKITNWVASDIQFLYQSVKDFLKPKMYTIEEIKSSKIAILVESEKDVDYLRSIDCYGYLAKHWGFPYYTNPKDKSWCSGTSYFEYNNYTTIHINQIITPNMEKKQEIIGYKLIKPEYKEVAEKIAKSLVYNGVEYDFSKDTSIENLKRAGVLDLWLEKVYREEFKIGDWVIIIQDCSWNGKTFQIEQKMLIEEKSYYHLRHKDFGAYMFPNQIRLATKEEIKQSQEKVYTLGIDEKFEIIVRDKKAFFKEEDVTQDLLEIQEYAQEFINKKYTTKNYTWNFDVIVNSVGCISYKSLLSEWLTIDLT